MSKATTSVVTAPRSVDFSLSLIGIGFFASGFCSLLYQIIWTRLAFAAFGIITPVLSVVVSVFMLGLGIGSIWGGRWAAAAARRAAQSMLHWRKRGTTIDQIATRIIDSRISFRGLLPKHNADIPALSDQRPFNEYFLLRRVGLYP
ncbi:hypothetical protein ACOSOMT5_P2251 [Acidiphilium sp. MT5]